MCEWANIENKLKMRVLSKRGADRNAKLIFTVDFFISCHQNVKEKGKSTFVEAYQIP
jgi:hypothetical protein